MKTITPVFPCLIYEDELSDFHLVQDKFIDYSNIPEMYTISSFDCKKSISLLNKEGYNVLPHNLFTDISDLKECANYCESNKSLLTKALIYCLECINLITTFEDALFCM